MFAGLVDSIRQLSPVHFLAVGLVTGAIIFSPEGLAETLGIQSFRKEYGGWLGATFLLTWAYLLASALWWLKTKIEKKTKNERERQILIKQLQNLTKHEKYYLSPFIFDEETSITFPMNDGIAGGLRGKKILYLGSQIGTALEGFPHNLQPWAREHLNDNPGLLDGAEAPIIEQPWDGTPRRMRSL